VEHEDGVLPSQCRQIPQEDVPFRLKEIQPRHARPAVEDGLGRRGPFVGNKDVAAFGWMLFDDAADLRTQITPAVKLPDLVLLGGDGKEGPGEMGLHHQTGRKAQGEAGGQQAAVEGP